MKVSVKILFHSIWSRNFMIKISAKIIGGLNSTTLFQRSFFLYAFSVFKYLYPPKIFGSQLHTPPLPLRCSSGPKNTLLVTENRRILTWRTKILHLSTDVQLRAFPKIQDQVTTLRQADWESDPKSLISNGLIIDAGFAPATFCCKYYISWKRGLTKSWQDTALVLRRSWAMPSVSVNWLWDSISV